MHLHGYVSNNSMEDRLRVYLVRATSCTCVLCGRLRTPQSEMCAGAPPDYHAPDPDFDPGAVSYDHDHPTTVSKLTKVPHRFKKGTGNYNTLMTHRTVQY